MMLKNNGEKTCITCGRIITDPNKMIRLCPKCSKKVKTGGVAFVIAITGFAIKKKGKPLLNLAKNLIWK